jgi:hypothetical protein
VYQANPTDQEVQTRVPDYLGIPGQTLSSPQAKAKAVQASPIDQVKAGDPPVFVANSQHEFVPLSMNQAFVKKLSDLGIPNQLVTPASGHATNYTCEVIGPSFDFVNKYLTGSGGGISLTSGTSRWIWIGGGLALLIVLMLLAFRLGSRRLRVAARHRAA